MLQNIVRRFFCQNLQTLAYIWFIPRNCCFVLLLINCNAQSGSVCAATLKKLQVCLSLKNSRHPIWKAYCVTGNACADCLERKQIVWMIETGDLTETIVIMLISLTSARCQQFVTQIDGLSEVVCVYREADLQRKNKFTVMKSRTKTIWANGEENVESGIVLPSNFVLYIHITAKSCQSLLNCSSLFQNDQSHDRKAKWEKMRLRIR